MERICREKAVNLPNLLTLARIALLPAIVLRYRRGDMAGALVFYLLSMLTDAADGFAARALGQTTHLGSLLDPAADKLSLLTLLWMFAADGQIPAWVLFAVMAKELILIAGSVFALTRGVVVYALPIGKATTFTFVLSTAMRFLGRKRPADLLLWCSLLLSAAALICYCLPAAPMLLSGERKKESCHKIFTFSGSHH